jgi:hypothetical protein
MSYLGSPCPIDHLLPFSFNIQGQKSLAGTIFGLENITAADLFTEG